MTDAEINVAIAEVCGWRIETKEFKMADGAQTGRRWVHPNHGPATTGGGLHGWGWNSGAHASSLPNYCNDLNAMHEAFESKPPEPFRDDFNFKCELAWQLQLIVERDYDSNPHWDGPFPKLNDQIWAGRNFWICNATAQQRAEAFLKTIGKWRDK